jgi:hypothetical protein
MFRMKHKYSLPILAAAMLTLFAAAAQAQETPEQLKRKLQERDKVISELLDRVEALERRVGVERLEPEAGAAAAVETDAGGTRPAPGTVVVSEEDAERALERSLTRAGAVLLRSGVLEAEPSFTYARREDRTPAFVATPGGIVAGETERNSNSLTGNLALRLGLPWDSQLEVGLPYRWREVETVTNIGFAPVDASTESGAGAGDINVGLAKTLLREGLWAPDVVGRVTWDSDSGETDNGLSFGSGFQELRGSLSAIKRQDPIAFVGGLSYQHAFEKDDVQPGQTWSASFGSYVALSPETSLRFLLSGGYQDETELFGAGVSGSDRTLGTFTVGGSTLLAPGILMNLSAGIGLTDDADDFSITLSLPIRFDGPLF